MTSGCIGQAKPVGAASAMSFIPQLGQRPGSSLTTSGCIGQRVDERAVGADVGLAHVHLGHERQRLVRRRVDQRREPLALGA